MPDDHIFRVRVVSTGWGGSPGLNTFYFLRDDTREPDPATAALDCVTRVRAAMFGVGPSQPSNWTATVDPAVDILNADNGDLLESHIVAAPAAVVGTTSGPFGPQMAMVCGNLITPGIIDGRRVRGRVFIGPTAGTGDYDGTPSPAMVAGVANALNGLAGATSTQVQYAVWSRRKPVSLAHPTGLGGSAHVISSATVKDSFAVLRSRRQ